ncbi:putative zinc metalloproteinase [Smittium mucronatum]|uniref:Putative zinc metalloproteinase n=1 Tax=Smittium mucronatum TaxID=133383 RepID=A0A1R0H7Y5_9FUNG|nr:putative zinc metalloproteinase [Smittium mucronatum]
MSGWQKSNQYYNSFPDPQKYNQDNYGNQSPRQEDFYSNQNQQYNQQYLQFPGSNNFQTPPISNTSNPYSNQNNGFSSQFSNQAPPLPPRARSDRLSQPIPNFDPQIPSPFSSQPSQPYQPHQNTTFRPSFDGYPPNNAAESYPNIRSEPTQSQTIEASLNNLSFKDSPNQYSSGKRNPIPSHIPTSGKNQFTNTQSNSQNLYFWDKNEKMYQNIFFDSKPIKIDDFYGTKGKNICFTNVNENQLVHQRFIIIHGKILIPSENNGKVTVHHPYFPPMEYNVVGGFFKAIIELEAGDNNITFIFNNFKSAPIREDLLIKMKPNMDKPPLLLAMILGKDSVGKFDFDPLHPPKSNDYLELLRRKLICTAYLWQAFIAEQMRRAGYGFRTFRLEEEYVQDTMTNRDTYQRMNAKIHMVRSDKTVKEIQDISRCQQYKGDPNDKNVDRDSQFDIAAKALENYGGPFAKGGRKRYIAALSADSTWDLKNGAALGHAALGGSVGDYRLGVFGSHLCFSWPSCLEEVIPCFNDTTKLDLNYMSEDGNNSHEYWRSANVGMGAFLHEVGHMMTMPHTPTGIMIRGFDDYNKAFNISEPGNDGPILPSDEGGAHFHRSDLARLRYHPLTRFEGEESFEDDHSGVEAYFTEDGLVAKSDSGIHLVEAWVQDTYRYHYEYCSENFERRYIKSELTGSYEESMVDVPKTIVINYNALEEQCCHTDKENKINLKITPRSKDHFEIDDLKKQIDSSRVVCPNGLLQFSTVSYGSSNKESSEVLFLGDSFALQYNPSNQPPSYNQMQHSQSGNRTRNSQLALFPPTLRSIRAIFNEHYSIVGALEFKLSDNTSKIIGNVEKSTGKSVLFDIPENDGLYSILVRSGAWIDGFEFTTRLGKRSGLIGGTGGSGHMIIAPEGYVFTGIKVHCGDWLDGFSAQYSKIP